jgi:hypothetical protein
MAADWFAITLKILTCSKPAKDYVQNYLVEQGVAGALTRSFRKSRELVMTMKAESMIRVLKLFICMEALIHFDVAFVLDSQAGRRTIAIWLPLLAGRLHVHGVLQTARPAKERAVEVLLWVRCVLISSYMARNIQVRISLDLS